MIPCTDFPEKALSMADLRERLCAVPDRFEAAVAGLTEEECGLAVVPDEKTVRECAEHVAAVSLGWTDMLFEAVEDSHDTPRKVSLEWRQPLETRLHMSTSEALAVFREHSV